MLLNWEPFIYFLISTLIAVLLAYKDEIAEWKRRFLYKGKHHKRK